MADYMKRTSQLNAVLHVLHNGLHKRKEHGINCSSLIQKAIEFSPASFKGDTAGDGNYASLVMLELWRSYPGIHRFRPRPGAPFLYWVDNAHSSLDLAERQSKAKAGFKQKLMKAKGAQGLNFDRGAEPAKQSATFNIVRRPDGTTAGLLKDGVLYETLESLLPYLNERAI